MTDPAELLNAYLDGELDAAEQARVEAYLADSGEARAQLAGLAEIRTALRDLPPLDPPRPLVGPVSPSAAGWVRRAVPLLVAAAVVLVGGFLVIGRDGSDDPGAMDTSQLVALHRDAQRMMEDGGAGPPGQLEPVSDTSQVDHMPDDLGDGMQRMGIYGADGLVQLVYSDGAHVVSVFEQPHDAAAPMAGEPMTVADRDAMHQSMGGSELVMVSADEMVVTVVGEGDLDVLGAMAGRVLSA